MSFIVNATRVAVMLLLAGAPIAARPQTSAPQVPGQKSPAGPPASTSPSGGQSGSQGGDSKSASGSDAKQSASGKPARLSPVDPAPPPPKVFARPRIGLALGGGGAEGFAEIGALQWFENNHIPVDEIAGASMGCMVAALYATGRTPAQLRSVVNDKVFSSVFTFSNAYTSRSFRRRQDSRELPNAITIGLHHGVSFRNAVLTDQGLNAFLDREFLRYDDQTDFNTLPIPLRCVATDLNEAAPATFARGSIPDAVRASVAIPAFFQPFELNGHEYVDGGVIEDLPTPEVRAMQPDVVIAFSLPLGPVTKGELGSILGVFDRSFSVAVEALEREERKLADVVIIPDITGYTVTDFLKADPLYDRGYQAAEAHRAELMKYALSDADWQAYLAHRASLIRGPAGPVLRVRVTAPDRSTTIAVQRLFAPLVNQPVDTAKIEALLDQVRSDGAYEADYTIGYETPQQFAAQSSGQAPVPAGTAPVPAETQLPQAPGDAKPTQRQAPGAPDPKPAAASTSDQPGIVNADRPGAPGLAATQEATPQSLADISARPIILVTVAHKKTGPPFLLAGVNIETQTSAFTRATIEGILLDQDLGGYGSEFRGDVKLGYVTELSGEYFRPVLSNAAGDRIVFVAPQGDFIRKPFPIYVGLTNVANRQLQQVSGGADIGFTNKRTQELRAGIDFEHLSWTTTIGSDGQPGLYGNAQRARLRYDYDTQDRALVPQFGIHALINAGYLFTSINSLATAGGSAQSAPTLDGKLSFAHRFALSPAPPPGAKPDPKRGHEVFILSAQGGTLFDRSVAQPFRYTLGGPMRLSASAIDQYRGTDYWLVEPALLRRIAQLPSPLGQAIYLGLGLEAARIYAPGMPTLTREDGWFGVVAETPLGAITLAPAIGSNGERKFVFTLGKLF